MGSVDEAAGAWLPTGARAELEASVRLQYPSDVDVVVKATSVDAGSYRRAKGLVAALKLDDVRPPAPSPALSLSLSTRPRSPRPHYWRRCWPPGPSRLVGPGSTGGGLHYPLQEAPR